MQRSSGQVHAIFRTQLYGTAFRNFAALDEDMASAFVKLNSAVGDGRLGHGGDFFRRAGWCLEGQSSPQRAFGPGGFYVVHAGFPTE